MAHGSDTCYCGDYRSQHNRGPNKMCFCGCTGFKEGRKSTTDERLHWEHFHGPNARIDTPCPCGHCAHARSFAL